MKYVIEAEFHFKTLQSNSFVIDEEPNSFAEKVRDSKERLSFLTEKGKIIVINLNNVLYFSFSTKLEKEPSDEPEVPETICPSKEEFTVGGKRIFIKKKKEKQDASEGNP